MKAIFIKETGVRFTNGKVYDLLPLDNDGPKQANTIIVVDDNNSTLWFTNGLDYWKPLTQHRKEIIDSILL